MERPHLRLLNITYICIRKNKLTYKSVCFVQKKKSVFFTIRGCSHHVCFQPPWGEGESAYFTFFLDTPPFLADIICDRCLHFNALGILFNCIYFCWFSLCTFLFTYLLSNFIQLEFQKFHFLLKFGYHVSIAWQGYPRIISFHFTFSFLVILFGSKTAPSLSCNSNKLVLTII